MGILFNHLVFSAASDDAKSPMESRCQLLERGVSQARFSFCCPTNSINALKASDVYNITTLNVQFQVDCSTVQYGHMRTRDIEIVCLCLAQVVKVI